MDPQMDPALKKAMEAQEAAARQLVEEVARLAREGNGTGGGLGRGPQMQPAAEEALKKAMEAQSAAGRQAAEELLRWALEGR
ncbi:hypothetical protein ABZ924_14270 [Streptomyces sp. NPDC046876]|uniref:hypothetical protein n=1 Tax=Streptomyces sp. NPDC046876 TaxID=3155616 RepID=UPI0033C68709